MIKIKVSRHPIEYGVNLEPVSKSVKSLIAASNAYDGSYSTEIIYTQNVESFLEQLSPSQATKVKYTLDTGWDCVIQLDEWTYRHMVGGQSD